MTVICNKFDARIKDLSDIQSFKQYDDKYVGRSGYFSNSMCKFQDLTICVKSTLTGIDKDVTAGDYIFENGYSNFRYFLPESLLKEEKTKKYRPYTVMEFIEEYPLGSHLHFRPKSNTMEMHRLIDGYNEYKNGNGTVFMCGTGFSMSELYDNYKIYRNGKWQPFGIEE